MLPLDFLSALGLPPGLEIRLLGAGAPVILWPDDIAVVWPTIEAANRRGYNAYFGVCPRRERRGTRENILRAPALWADLDCKDSGGKRQAMERLRQALPPGLQPSILVDSGHGYHAYWLLSTPWEFTSQERRERFEALLRALAFLLGGDPAVADVARLLRLPGTMNQKSEPLPCYVVDFAPQRRFAAADLHPYLHPYLPQFPAPARPARPLSRPAGAATIARATREFLERGAPVGERNCRAFAAACDLAGCGYPYEEALAAITAAAAKCGLPAREAAAVVRSAYSRPRHPARAWGAG